MSEQPQSPGYTGRFVFIYLSLAVILVAAVTGVVVLAMKPGPPKPLPWSAWKPHGGSSSKMTGEIVSHVSSQYKLNQSGDNLVVVLPSSPEITQNTKVENISTLAVRASATSSTLSRVISTSGIVEQQFCGLGASCAISKGTPSAARERLVRREALEIALYTFKYVPSVNGVLAYMPPPPGQPASTLLFLERSALERQLAVPLKDTLPLQSPPLPTQPDPSESTTIDRLTLPVEYGFQYQALDAKSQAIILTPTSS